jgi:hypothetical protein
MRVLDMNESNGEQIRALAANVAVLVSDDSSEFGKFVHAARRTTDLQKWLRRQAIGQARYTTKPGAFITENQWRLLFDSEDAFLHRDLLLIAALEQVHKLDPQWRTDDAEKRKDTDDDFGNDDEGQNS